MISKTVSKEKLEEGSIFILIPNIQYNSNQFVHSIIGTRSLIFFLDKLYIQNVVLKVVGNTVLYSNLVLEDWASYFLEKFPTIYF